MQNEGSAHSCLVRRPQSNTATASSGRPRRSRPRTRTWRTDEVFCSAEERQWHGPPPTSSPFRLSVRDNGGPQTRPIDRIELALDRARSKVPLDWPRPVDQAAFVSIDRGSPIHPSIHPSIRTMSKPAMVTDDSPSCVPSPISQTQRTTGRGCHRQEPDSAAIGRSRWPCSRSAWPLVVDAASRRSALAAAL